MVDLKQFTYHSLKVKSDPISEPLHKLVFYFRGRGVFRNGDHTISFTGPTLIYTPPGMVQSLKVDRKWGRTRHYTIAFLWPWIPAVLKKTLEEKYMQGGLPAAGNFLPFLEEQHHLYTRGGELMKKAVEHRLSAWLYDLCMEESPAGKEDEIENEHIKRAVSLLNTMTGEVLDVRALAARIGLNTSYFIRLFKRHTGTTPLRYLQYRKIDMAAWDLAHSGANIPRIAEDLKFYDEFHFSRVFKSIKGISPKKYREQMKR